LQVLVSSKLKVQIPAFGHQPFAIDRHGSCIASATGHLGSAIVNASTHPSFSPYFSNITFLSRNAGLDIRGATTAVIREHDLASLKAALEGVNVAVNGIGSRGYELRDLLVRAVADPPSVKVYFPSEFGVN
jgi:NmrA-like family